MRRALTALVGGALLAACSGGASVRSAPPTSVASTPGSSTVGGATTSSPTTAIPPPATVALAPQKTPDLAATALLTAWRKGDRQAAMSVATPAAVTAIFTLPSQVFSDRGCQTPLNGMATCAFGLGGQAAIVQVLTVALAGGWVVQSVAANANN